MKARGVTIEEKQKNKPGAVTAAAPSSQAAQTSVAALIVKTLKYNDITVDEGFAEFDTDEDGFISTQDLMLTAKDLNLTDNLDSDQIMQWHAAANVSRTGKLDRSEWVSGLEGANADAYKFVEEAAGTPQAVAAETPLRDAAEFG